MLVLYFDFTKATVLVSLPLDLITLLAPVLLGSFIPDTPPIYTLSTLALPLVSLSTCHLFCTIHGCLLSSNQNTSSLLI